MLRLALLTLDERYKAFPLILAHTLTAFPSSFLPFKIGEVLRLAAFFHVFKRRQKALAVWMAERFGDVLVPYAEEDFTDGLYKPLLVFLRNAHALVEQWPVYRWSSN